MGLEKRIKNNTKLNKENQIYETQSEAKKALWEWEDFKIDPNYKNNESEKEM